MNLLTIFQVADRCHVSTMTIRRWWYAGAIPAPIKIRGSLRWRADDIDQWIASQSEYAVSRPHDKRTGEAVHRENRVD